VSGLLISWGGKPRKEREITKILGQKEGSREPGFFANREKKRGKFMEEGECPYHQREEEGFVSISGWGEGGKEKTLEGCAYKPSSIKKGGKKEEKKSAQFEKRERAGCFYHLICGEGGEEGKRESLSLKKKRLEKAS